MHDLVRGPVVIIRADGLHHVGDGVLGQQHSAENALLRGYVVRWGAIEAFTPGCDLGNAHRHHLPVASSSPAAASAEGYPPF